MGRRLPDSRRHNGEPSDTIDPVEAETVAVAELREVMAEVWHGPTPSPRTLQQFESIDPSFAERAFAMSEQSVAASNQEKTLLATADAAAIKRGQWMSFSLTAAFIAAAITALLLDSEVLAVVFVSPPVFQYLGKMVRTVRRQEDDRVEGSAS